MNALGCAWDCFPSTSSASSCQSQRIRVSPSAFAPRPRRSHPGDPSPETLLQGEPYRALPGRRYRFLWTEYELDLVDQEVEVGPGDRRLAALAVAADGELELVRRVLQRHVSVRKDPGDRIRRQCRELVLHPVGGLLARDGAGRLLRQSAVPLQDVLAVGDPIRAAFDQIERPERLVAEPAVELQLRADDRCSAVVQLVVDLDRLLLRDEGESIAPARGRAVARREPALRHGAAAGVLEAQVADGDVRRAKVVSVLEVCSSPGDLALETPRHCIDLPTRSRSPGGRVSHRANKPFPLEVMFQPQ